MSSPPVDPWSGQPEHDPTYTGPPAWPDDWTPSGGHPPYDQGWSATPQPGVSTPPPTGHYPTLPYGAPPNPTTPYSAPPTPTTPYSAPPAATGPYSAPPAATGPYGGYPPQQQAGFAPAGYPAPVGAPPGQRRPASLAVTLSIIGVLAVLLGGGGLTYFALSDRETPDDGGLGPSVAPTATMSPGPTTETTPYTTASPDPQIRLVTPDTLAGRPKSTDPKLQKLASDMVRDVRSKLDDDNGVVGSFYGSPADRNMAMVVAASAFVLSPTAEIEDAIEGITDDLSVTGMTTIAPGPLGGVAKCGNGKSADVSLGVCAWADHGSVGLIVVFFSNSAAAAAEFGTIRAAVELRD